AVFTTSTTLPAYSHSDCGFSWIVSTVRSSRAGQAAMAFPATKNRPIRKLVRKRRIGLERLECGTEVALDAFQGGGVVGFEAHDDGRRGVGGAGEPEAVSILHAHAVDGNDALGAGERLGRLQLRHQCVRLAFLERPVELRR